MNAQNSQAMLLAAVTKWLGRADVQRIDKDGPNSDYVRLRVYAQNGTLSVYDGGSTFIPYYSGIDGNAVLRVDILSYGVNDAISLDALSGIAHYVEGVDTLFVAIDRDDNLNIIVTDVLRFNRADRTYYHTNDVPALDLQTLAQKFVHRAEANHDPVDTRKETWVYADGTTLTTAYGHYRAQRIAARQ